MLDNLLKDVQIDTSRFGHDFALDTRMLELEMAKYNGGLDLTLIDTETDIPKEMCEQYVPFNIKNDKKSLTKMVDFLRKFNPQKKPCSMKLDSTEELIEHMLLAYQVSHFHYILGKKENFKGSFPTSCCGASSDNVTMSLINHGYINAVLAETGDAGDHSYVLLPFVIRDKDINGSVLIDPTSDQLWTKNGPRNSVVIKLGETWTYHTDWKGGVDLFPEQLTNLYTYKRLFTKSIIPNLFEHMRYCYKDGQKYLREAFANPVRIS